jgi:hypothetical protein
MGAEMGDDMRWTHEEAIPVDVRAEMRDLLAEALREAARTEDPGDGSMILLSPEKMLGKGMWDGGWKLQSSFVEDERMNASPFVAVYAYHGSQLAKGSVAADVVRTPEDRHYLGRQRLESMTCRRDKLNAAIDKLSAELDEPHPRDHAPEKE